MPPFIDQTNEFVDDVPGIVDDLREQIHDATGAKPGEIADRVQEFAERYTDDPARLIGPITSIGLSVAGVLGALVLCSSPRTTWRSTPTRCVHGPPPAGPARATASRPT